MDRANTITKGLLGSRNGPHSYFMVCGGVLFAALLLSGCGKKAPPVAPHQRPLTAVADLTSDLDQGHVHLTWSHSPDNWAAVGYIVLRAQRELSQAECNDCPMVFQKAASVPLERSLRKEKHSLDFSETLATGFRYTFSVRPVLASGAQGPDSNRVVIDLPPSGENENISE